VDLLDIILTGIIDLKYLDVSNSPQLISLYCWDTTIEELDLSRNYNLIDLIIGTNLKYLNIKNNSQESLACLADLDALTFICADEEDLEDIDMLLEGCTVNEVTVSTNCISPFDQPSTLFVKSYLDTINNNLCEETDLILRIPLKFQSTSNSNPFWECVQFYSNIGAYKLPAEEFNCTPLLGELEECFIIEPNNVLLDFTDTTSITQDFCITGIGESTNVGVGLISLDDDVRPGFNVQYKLKFYNHGSMSSDGLIRMSYNSELMDLVSSIPMMIEDGDNLIFEYENLLPFEERNIILEFNLNTPTDDPALNDGDFLEYTVFIFPENADLKRTDNFSYLSQEVINSFDPNDKTCMQGKFLMDTLVGSYLTYKIRFENIGTASAVNVLIEDKIDTTVFDTESMVIEDASHDLLAYVREDRINFNFLDIFLPFEDEFNDGYVVFKIKTKNNMQVGDVIRNQASIVFDFNEAIITNIAETTIVTDADQDGYHNLEDCDDADANVNPDAEEIAGNDIDEDCDGEILSSVDNLYRLSFSLFPNPAEDILNINQHNLANFQVRVIDLNGKVLVQGNNLTKIDVSTFEDGIYLMENMDLESGVRGSQRFMVY